MGLIICSVAIGSLVVIDSSPADAQTEPPNDSCSYHDEKDTFLWYRNAAVKQEFNIYPAGNPFWKCGDEPDGYNCKGGIVEPGIMGGDSGVAGTILSGITADELHICAVDQDAGVEYIDCRNDIRFALLNPSEEEAAMPLDDFGVVLVSQQMRNDHAWWVEELKNESEDGDGGGGQGCDLADHPPEGRPCAVINEEKQEIWEQIRHFESNIGSGNSNVHLSHFNSELDKLEHTDGVIPDDCWGTYPNSHYTLTWDQQDDELLDGTRLMGWLATMLFGFSKGALSIMLWLTRMAFTFDVTEYASTVAEFAGKIDRGIVSLGKGSNRQTTFTLFDIAWFALFVYAGMKALKGKIGQAGGEILLSILLVSVGFYLLGDIFRFPLAEDGEQQAEAYRPGGTFESASDVLHLSGVALLRVANGEDPNVERDSVDRGFIEAELNNPGEPAEGDNEGSDEKGVLSGLHMEFMERPYMFINYGKETFEDSECQEVHENVLAVPDRSGSWVQRYMERHGCDEEAEFNGKMTTERLMSTVLVTVVTTIVSVLVGLAAVTLLLSKFLVAVFFVALPLAIVAAILPGRSRQLAWGWFTGLLQLWLAALGMGLVVAVLLMGMDAIQETTQGRGLTERWLMVLLLVVVIYMIRKRLVAGSQNMAKELSERLSTTGAGSPNWAGAGAGHRGSVDLMGADRAGARTGFAARAGAVMAGTIGARMVTGGARLAGRAGLRVGGAPYRIGRQRRQEYRAAAKSGKRHWQNINAMDWMKRVRNQPSRRDTRVVSSREARQRMQAKHLKAHARDVHLEHDLAKGDAARIGKITSGRGRAARREDANALRRVGVSDRDIQAWNSGSLGNDARAKVASRMQKKANDAVTLTSNRANIAGERPGDTPSLRSHRVARGNETYFSHDKERLQRDDNYKKILGEHRVQARQQNAQFSYEQHKAGVSAPDFVQRKGNNLNKQIASESRALDRQKDSSGRRRRRGSS